MTINQKLIELRIECAKSAYHEWCHAPPVEQYSDWDNLPTETKQLWMRIASSVLTARETFWNNNFK